MSTLVAGTYTGAATKIASAILAGYSTPVANGSTIRSALFSNGEKGVWFDPSDFSTLFQDSAGATPVTAVGQPVGLMLDKSNGLVLGPELVTNGDFSAGSTGWTPGTGWTISGGVASVIAASGTVLRQAKTITAGKAYQIQVDITSYTAGTIYVQFSTAGSQVGPNFTSAGTKRVILIANANYANFDIAALAGTTASIDNISIKELPGNHATQATSTKRPVLQIDANGKYYLAFDGVDDFLVTPSIDFSATDKMSVFAGVRKLSDAAIGMLLELSVSYAANNGSIIHSVSSDYLGTTGPYYRAGSRGDLAAAVGQNVISTPFAAPITNVWSTTHDIAGALTAVRLNGIAAGTATGSKGGGNFGNYPLYIGMRAGTSLPFNGQLYSLIVRGALSDANQIAATETYVNSQTGAY